jgi:hypothetical protein
LKQVGSCALWRPWSTVLALVLARSAMSEDGRALRCEPEAVGSASKDAGTSR